MANTSRWITVAAGSAIAVGLLAGCSVPTPSADVSSVPPSSATPLVPPTPESSGSGSPAPKGQPQVSVTPQPVVSSATVKVSRSGGIAGLNQLLQINPDGSWVFTDRRSGSSKQGRLTAAQLLQLRELTSAPALLADARLPAPPIACADGITWVISVGELTVREEQCGGGNRPAIDAVIRLVTDATAM
jgi:hypothetical protein